MTEAAAVQMKIWKCEKGAFLQKTVLKRLSCLPKWILYLNVHKKKWISVNLSKNGKLFHLTILRPCHNVWWQFISAENQINSNTRSLYFGGTKNSSWNKTLRFLGCCWRPVIEIPWQSSLPIKLTFSNIFIWLLTERLWRNKKWN